VVTRCLRKSAAERYPGCAELISDLKVVRREAEGGVSGPPRLLRRLQERLRASTSGPHRERPAVVAGVLLSILAALLVFTGVAKVDILVPLLGGLLAWRRFRHRRQRLGRKFVRKARRLPEVQLVTLDGLKLTVATTNAVAGTYVRLRATLDEINSAMFFGDPFTLVVRDGLPPDTLKTLLATSGVLYVREEVP
jgi:hypothetical protein